jgi:hypothetical protein
MVIAMFTIMWNKKIVDAPMTISVTKGSEDSLLIEVALHRNKA